jgi:thiol-disulfide isomerase/thioredoxin
VASRRLNVPALTALIAVICLSQAIVPAGAAPSSYAQGVELYSHGKYSQALQVFQSAVKTSPDDASSRYYLALCFLALKQASAAREQFEWVSQNAAEPTLKAYAAKAMKAIPGPAGAATVATDEDSSGPANNQSQRQKLGRCKVLMFETSWCHYCHEFAPHFDDVAGKNRNTMDFQRLDAEAPSNAGLRQKYNVRSYPRLVYLDGSGNVLYNEGRGPFDVRVQQLAGK